MLAHDRLLDLVENFILFDASKPGATRKVVARNHQVLGVNNAVASVQRQEELKRQFPPEKRLAYRVSNCRRGSDRRATCCRRPRCDRGAGRSAVLELVERAHPDLGKLGVFWHTQGSGKSYSMAFFAEKVRRAVSAQFHLPADDRPQRSRQPDLPDLRRLRRCRRADAACRARARICKALLQGEPPLRLQPDPQVQSGRRSARALQHARRHHRHLRRGAPHAGRQARPQHAARAAERGLHRLHRHAAVQARRPDQAHLRRLRFALRLQALRGRRRDGEAGLRKPRREARHRPARPQRPHRRRRSPRPNSTRTRRRAGKAARARTTRSSPPTTGWTRSPPTSSSIARRAGNPASRCWCASTRSPARGCYQRIMPRWQAKLAEVQSADSAKRG